MLGIKQYISIATVVILSSTLALGIQPSQTASAAYSSISPILPPVITQIQVPGVPIGLTANVVSSSEIDLSWSPPTSNGGSQITGYMIEKDSGNGFVVLVQNTDSTLTSYKDTGLDAAKAYSYRVYAINSAGISSPSNSITETTFSALPSSTVQLKPQPLPPVATPPQSTTPKAVKIEYFLKIDGIDGESQVAGENGAIDLVGWSWGAANPNSATFQNDLNQAFQQQSSSEITITKKMDKASPKLMEACASGQHIKSLEIDGMADVGSGPQEFLKITLTDVLVSSYQVSGSGSENPTEQVSFNFGKMDQPHWDQTVLQNAASQRMAMASYLKYTFDLAKTALTAPTPLPMAAVDYFLKINYLDQQSQPQNSNIQLDSFSWGVSKEASGSGGGAGKVSFQDFHFTPKSSESVSLNFATIKPTSITFQCVQYREGDLVSFSFGTPAITGFQTGGSSGETVPSESLSLNFAKIEMNYKPQTSGGVKVGWDLQTNAPISSLAPNVQGQQVPANKVPAWIHNNAKFWAKGQISDLDFEAGIKYLIDNQVIKLNATQSQENSSQSNVPSWVRHNADWWSQGLISDDEFLKALEYMVNHGIIHLNKAALATFLKTNGIG